MNGYFRVFVHFAAVGIEVCYTVVFDQIFHPTSRQIFNCKYKRPPVNKVRKYIQGLVFNDDAF